MGLAVAAVMTPSNFSTPSASTRYFIPLAFVVILLVVAGVRSRRPTAYALAAALAIGIAMDFRVPTYPDARWPEAAACLEQATRCRIETLPDVWSFTWPGREDYRRPEVPADIIDNDCCADDGG